MTLNRTSIDEPPESTNQAVEQKKAPRRVLLATGIDAVGASRLPCLFAASGYEVCLLGSPHILAWQSRYVSRRFPCPRGPEATAVALFRHLAEHADDYQLVVAADEPTLCETLSSPLRGAAHDKWLPVPSDKQSIQRLESKIDFLLDVRAGGVPTPRFELCGSAEEVLNAADKIGYPVFLKASQGSAGSGLRFAKSRAEVEAQLSRFSFDPFVCVQERVEGDAGSTSVLFHKGKLICWFSYLAYRTWPTAFAASCQVEFIDHPDVERIASAVGNITQFSGLAGLDWIRNRKDGRLVVLEFNPRPTPVYHLGPFVGVNFSTALRELPHDPQVQRPNSVQIRRPLFPQNLFSSAERRNLGEFVATFADAPWDDPRLVISHLRRVVTHYIPESWKNRLKGQS